MQKILCNKRFAENLRKIRKAQGLTQEQTVAKLQLLGSPLSRSSYAHIEAGHANIFVTDLVALKQVFEVEFEVFFTNIPTERVRE